VGALHDIVACATAPVLYSRVLSGAIVHLAVVLCADPGIVSVAAVSLCINVLLSDVEGVVIIASITLDLIPSVACPDDVVAITTISVAIKALGVVTSVDDVIVAPKVLVEVVGAVLEISEEIFVACSYNVFVKLAEPV